MFIKVDDEHIINTDRIACIYFFGGLGGNVIFDGDKEGFVELSQDAIEKLVSLIEVKG